MNGDKLKNLQEGQYQRLKIKVKFGIFCKYFLILSHHLCLIMNILKEIMKDQLLNKPIGFQDPRSKVKVKVGKILQLLFKPIISIIVKISKWE